MHLRRSAATLGAVLLVCLLTPAPAGAAEPQVTTGGVTELQPTGTAVTGRVNPRGESTTVVVRFGESATKKLSRVSDPVLVGSEAKSRPVRILISGLKAKTKYSYRLEASSEDGTRIGNTRSFTTPVAPTSVTLAGSPATVVFGSSAVLSGTVGGTGAGGAKVTPQRSEFPFAAGFAANGNPLIADSLGAFTQTVVPNVSTRYRVIADVDKRSVTSPVVTVAVAPAVSISVRRRSGRRVSFSGSFRPGGEAVVRLHRLTSTGRRSLITRTTVPGSGTSTRYRFRARRIGRTAPYLVTVTPTSGAFVRGESRTRRVRRATSR